LDFTAAVGERFPSTSSPKKIKETSETKNMDFVSAKTFSSRASAPAGQRLLAQVGG